MLLPGFRFLRQAQAREVPQVILRFVRVCADSHQHNTTCMYLHLGNGSGMLVYRPPYLELGSLTPTWPPILLKNEIIHHQCPPLGLRTWPLLLFEFYNVPRGLPDIGHP